MMSNVMEYKGYRTKIEFVSESKSLRGKIEGINDYVDFEADNILNIEEEFHSAVDDYLEFCAEVGKEPEKEYKGTFNVRISPICHRKLALLAIEDGMSLNAEVEKAIEILLESSPSQKKESSGDSIDSTETFSLGSAENGNETIVDSSKIIDFVKYNHLYHDEVKTQ